MPGLSSHNDEARKSWDLGFNQAASSPEPRSGQETDCGNGLLSQVLRSPEKPVGQAPETGRPVRLIGNGLFQWKPSGCIAFRHSNGVIAELTRFGFPMTVDDEDVAKCFGLEIARLILNASFRQFEIARRESKQRTMIDIRRRR